MSQSARNNSHASSACVNCRNRKRKCSGSGPTCVSCAEKNIQCEWTIETDGRRIGRNLQIENASLRAEVAELRALVDALRAGALEELSLYATQQLPLYLDGEHGAPFLHTNAQHGQHATFARMPFNNQLPGLNTDSLWSCPPLQWQNINGAAAEAAVGPCVEPADVQVNVFGPGAAPLYTGNAMLDR